MTRSERNSHQHLEPADLRNFLGQTELRAAKACAWGIVAQITEAAL